MFDREILASQVKPDRFPFPCEGEITLAVRNKSYALGPVMLHLVMKPRRFCTSSKNEGKQHIAGTSLHVEAGKAHGPHSTSKGCTLLVLWTDKSATQDANLNDFRLAETSQSGVAE